MITISESTLKNHGPDVAILCSILDPVITFGQKYNIEGINYVWFDREQLLTEMDFWSEEKVDAVIQEAIEKNVVQHRLDPIDKTGSFFRFRWSS